MATPLITTLVYNLNVLYFTFFSASNVKRNISCYSWNSPTVSSFKQSDARLLSQAFPSTAWSWRLSSDHLWHQSAPGKNWTNSSPPITAWRRVMHKESRNLPSIPSASTSAVSPTSRLKLAAPRVTCLWRWAVTTFGAARLVQGTSGPGLTSAGRSSARTPFWAEVLLGYPSSVKGNGWDFVQDIVPRKHFLHKQLQLLNWLYFCDMNPK